MLPRLLLPGFVLVGLSGVARADVADASKGVLLSDLDDPAAKLPRTAKVKECCGYPLALREGFRISFYWLAYESDYAHEKYDVDIYDRMGFWIGRYPSAFVWELKMEGTGVLRDGRVLNYDGNCGYGMGTCFAALAMDEHPLGRGVQARALQPFRSVAVDPRLIPIGSPLWVPELVGVELPDGTVHDGCVRADDQGGAIKNAKLDFFVESYFNFKFIADQMWWRLKATPHLEEPRCEYLRVGDPRERLNERSQWASLRAKRPAVAARHADRPPGRQPGASPLGRPPLAVLQRGAKGGKGVKGATLTATVKVKPGRRGKR